MIYRFKPFIALFCCFALVAGFAFAQAENVEIPVTEAPAEPEGVAEPAPPPAAETEAVSEEILQTQDQTEAEQAPQETVVSEEESSETSGTVITQIQEGVSDIEAPVNGYVRPTIRNIAKLYFKHGFRTPENEEAVESMIALNECSTYQRFRRNDIEWTEIFNSYQAALPKIIKGFPRRYVFSQVLSMGEYDAETQMFEVYEKSKIDDTQVFLIEATSAGGYVCGEFPFNQLPEIPFSTVFKTNKPFTLKEVKMPPEIARKIIDEANIKYRELPPARKRPSAIYDLRRVYLYLYVDVFHMDEEGYQFGPRKSKSLPMFNVTMEKMEIYADVKNEELVYSENFRHLREIDDLEKKLRAEYQERRNQLAN
ncbi:MAG: DUF4852 domain-containing protein [Pseudomonadota bacterium]